MPPQQRGQSAAAASQTKGLPPGFKVYTPFPFSGMNAQDSAHAIDDKEWTYIENYVRVGNARLRTVWDIGTPLYSGPAAGSIASFYFYTLGTDYYVVIFFTDGGAVQINTKTLAQTTIAGAGTFYNSANGQVPACTQWGATYLLISNRNTVNDFWAWDGTTLYTSGTAAPNGVVIQANGEGYDTTPTVTAFGGHGSGMTFNTTVQSGGVVEIAITNPGTGYQVGDIVQLAFSGGGSDTSPQLVANLNAGGVAAANITAPGSGYTSGSVAFSGGGGTGAAGTVVISSGVAAVNVTAGGTGYSGANISFTGGGGSGATASATIVGGIITSISVVTPGSGYTSNPTVGITGDGTGATATASINNGQIVGITITAPGSGYTSAPSIAISGTGAGATAVALLTSASIQGVTVVNGGSNFLYAPGVTFEGGGGTGATGVATLTSTSIAQVNVVAGGQNYQKAPTISFTGGGSGSGAAATAVMGGGQVIAVNVTDGGSGYTQNVEVIFTPQKNDTGSGAGAIAIFTPTTISGVIMSNYGLNYTDAPTVVVQSGANHSAYATVSLMPFGVSGGSMETFQSRLWIAYPQIESYATLPPGGNFQVSAPGSFTDFATSDGGVLFSNTDEFLQTRYTAIKQSNGYLYFFGDGSISVVSNTQTSGSPATTTFNYQNVDPQNGLSWTQSLQDYGRTLIFGNETGVYGLYGGAATKVSSKIDTLFLDAIFPPADTDVSTPTALAPSSAVATIFNVKHYLLLLTFVDPDTGNPVNKMVTWNEREWVVTSQSVNLTFIATQTIESHLTAWGTDGQSIYPLFQTPSSTLVKRLDTKLYGGQDLLMFKDMVGVWVSGQDQSTNLSGIDINVAFNVSGPAVQTNVAAPRLDTESVPSFSTTPANIDNLLYNQPNFQAPPPFWPVWASGGGGMPFIGVQAKLTSTSPDFILGHFAIGYTEIMAFYSGS